MSRRGSKKTLIPYPVLLTQGCFCFSKSFECGLQMTRSSRESRRCCHKEQVPNWKRLVVILLWKVEQNRFLPFPLLPPRHCQALLSCLAGSPRCCCWKDTPPSPPSWKARLHGPCRAKEMLPLAGELQWILSRAFFPNKLPNKRASTNHMSGKSLFWSLCLLFQL